MNSGFLRSGNLRSAKYKVCFNYRIIDATLNGALLAITSDRSKLVDHYERDAPILSETSVRRIVAGARCLDEMDSEGLAELQISAIVSSCPFSHPS